MKEEEEGKALEADDDSLDGLAVPAFQPSVRGGKEAAVQRNGAEHGAT